MCSNPSYNYPQQPSYGEGMADAMKAQMEMLTGTGDDFSTIYEEALGRKGGSLQDVLRQFEAPLRRETAQIDTDVLRQTLLGGEQKVVRDPETGKYGIPASTPVSREALPEGQSAQTPGGRYQMVSLGEDEYTIVDTKTGGTISEGDTLDWLAEKNYINNTGDRNTGGKDVPQVMKDAGYGSGDARVGKGRDLAIMTAYFQDLTGQVEEETKDGEVGEGEIETNFTFTNPNVPADPSKAGQPGFDSQGRQLLQEGEVVREGTGMVDLMGPTEAGMVTRERTQADIDALPPGVKRKTYEGYVDQDEKLLANYQRHLVNDPTLTKAQFGEEHFKKHGRREGRRLPEGMRLGEAMQVERRAGFDPVTGEFLGLTTLGADVSEQLARRQRAADIYDVEQLGGQATEAYRQQGVQYDPVTGEAIEGTGIAGALATARELGPGGTGPSAYREDPLGTFAGMGSRDPMRAAVTQGAGAAAEPQAGHAGGPPTRLQAGQFVGPQQQPAGTQPTGTELLRGTMLAQVQEGLGQGLTERERRNLREASRARATAMGRTFDPTATIDELKIQMLEDEGRRARNLAQAQAVLGGEVGIQQTDLERELRQAHMGEQLRQAGLGQERAAAAQAVGLEQATGADPFQAILGRPSGAGAAMGQQMLGQAGYGLQSGPQYLNPEAGLGYISNMAANEASMWGAGQQADASRYSGGMSLLGSLAKPIIGKLPVVCWVAREVYGVRNPAWLDFREWMLLRAPSWFRALYIGYGERFAKFISNKPRLKARIRSWMDTKIGRA